MTSIPRKQCRRCGMEYPATSEYFYPHKQMADGLLNICKECKRKQSNERYQLPEVKAKVRAYAQTPEHKAYERAYNASDAGRERARRHDRTPERIAERKRYAVEKKYVVKASAANKAAKRWGAVGRLSGEDIRARYEDQDGRCGYCGIPVFWDLVRDTVVDHMTPLRRGGSNTPDNIVICCEHCNNTKHYRTFEEWRAVRGW